MRKREKEGGGGGSPQIGYRPAAHGGEASRHADEELGWKCVPKGCGDVRDCFQLCDCGGMLVLFYGKEALRISFFKVP